MRLPRRRFLRRLGSLGVLPFAGQLEGRAGAAGLTVDELLAELDTTTASLRAGAIDGPHWQARVEELFTLADHQQLRAAISLDWKSLQREAREAGQAAQVLEPSALQGCPSDPAFRRKLWLFRKGHAIVPHGHRNLVSAFMVLDGRFRGRHYDRLRDEPDAIVIRPTDDRTFTAGDAAAICDQHDNVHWFTALDDDALLLHVGATLPEQLRGRPGLAGGSTERVYLDPEGELLEDGSIRARRASFVALRAKYDGEPT